MCENNRNDDLDKIFCDNISELARELEMPSPKEKRLFAISIILQMVTVFTIIMFYKYTEIDFFIKEIVTIVLMVLSFRFAHKLGIESGLEMSRKTAKSKDELRKRMVDRVVEMIRERIKNEGDD